MIVLLCACDALQRRIFRFLLERISGKVFRSEYLINQYNMDQKLFRNYV